MKMIGRQEYIDTEMEKTDLFLFVKYVNPSLYKRHFGDEEAENRE